MATPVSIFTAAKRLGTTSNWTLSHLQMQKMLYIAHMYYMGMSETHEELVYAWFEAWYYGPVCPELYHRLKRYGADPVPEEALARDPAIAEDHPGVEFLDGVVHHLADKNLITITHRSHGAWHKRYKVDTPNIPLLKEDILEEYENWMAKSNAR